LNAALPSQSRAREHDGTETPHFASLFAAEDRHFWFQGRIDLLARMVRELTSGLRPGYRIVEVGCGTGAVLQMLEKVCTTGQVSGMDLFEEGLEFARKRVSCPLICGDLRSPPFDTTFDLVGMFDVLEHIEDDRATLDHLFRLVRPGGRLLLTVPAHMSLWSYFDVSSGHYRRYHRADMRSKLTAAGFEVEFITEFMMTLFPLVWLGRRLNRLFRRNGPAHATNSDLAIRELRVVPVVNTLLLWLLRLENCLIARRWSLPVGTSLLAIARRPA
jgi:SAM-dependent methyltransferase